MTFFVVGAAFFYFLFFYVFFFFCHCFDFLLRRYFDLTCHHYVLSACCLASFYTELKMCVDLNFFHTELKMMYLSKTIMSSRVPVQLYRHITLHNTGRSFHVLQQSRFSNQGNSALSKVKK